MAKILIRIFLYTALIFQLSVIFNPYTVIDPELKPYDDLFHSYLDLYCPRKMYLKPIQKVIYFNDLRPGVMGVCTTNMLTKISIAYDPNVWHNITEDQRYSTSMHESVHCYFGDGHSDDPLHFMYKDENYLPRQIVEEQLITLIKERCK